LPNDNGTSVQRLLVAKRDLALERELDRLDRFDAVVLDDIGYVQQSREEMEVLFTFLSERYERRSVMSPATSSSEGRVAHVQQEDAAPPVKPGSAPADDDWFPAATLGGTVTVVAAGQVTHWANSGRWSATPLMARIGSGARRRSGRGLALGPVAPAASGRSSRSRRSGAGRSRPAQQREAELQPGAQERVRSREVPRRRGDDERRGPSRSRSR
jgi:hypothetical protein